VLLDDAKFNVVVAAGFDFAELMPTQLSTNLTHAGGAPFHNLLLGQPQYITVNRQNTQVSLPLSFNNNAAFDIFGTVSARIYDNDGRVKAETQAPIATPMLTHFTGKLVFLLPADSASQSSFTEGHAELFFSTSVFEYGPVVIPHS